jgi:hypothetical protein
VYGDLFGLPIGGVECSHGGLSVVNTLINARATGPPTFTYCGAVCRIANDNGPSIHSNSPFATLQ